ncbi:MAG: hypothetical protein SV375_05230, partial [Thermodesulfobacteriota bacterium]|nr:hypothetical protein [Thermodesulfobacteriota bacterium]
VMRTPLDDVDMETGEILAEAVGGDSFIDRFRLKYARENNLRVDEDEEYIPLFRLTINDPPNEEE